MAKRVEVGVVTGGKSPRTRRVEIPRLVRHPRFGKYLRRRTICYVHDERDEARVGDTVEIRECPPRSRTKRWELVRIIARASSLGVPAEPPAAT